MSPYEQMRYLSMGLYALMSASASASVAEDELQQVRDALTRRLVDVVKRIND